jgi:hypothetical protein
LAAAVIPKNVKGFGGWVLVGLVGWGWSLSAKVTYGVGWAGWLGLVTFGESDLRCDKSCGD